MFKLSEGSLTNIPLKEIIEPNEGIVCLGVIRDFKIQRRDGNENV